MAERPKVNMNRAKGYYWIRQALMWKVAYYSAEFKTWELPGINELFHDNDFHEIDENRITRDETADL